MKRVYIVLIKAHTGLGAVARHITGYPYTHIAVSLDRSMTDFVSFSRRFHNFPFDAGFTHEYRHYYAFGEHRYFCAKIFSLTVTDQNYSAITEYISECEHDSRRIFNLFSMATMPILGGFRIYRADNCMSFAAKIAELSGCVRMSKPYWRWSVRELDELLSDYACFEGKLVRGENFTDDEYMKSFSPLKYLTDMIKLISRLTFRAIFRRNRLM